MSQFLNQLKVIYSNCDSLTEAKQCELLNIKEEDIKALTEMYHKHATFETTAAYFHIENYDLFLTRESERSEIAIYTKSALKATQFTTESRAKEFPWCRIKLRDHNEIAFGCIYRSPSTTVENLAYINRMLKYVIDQRFSHILIEGDFSMKEIKWSLC